MTRPAVALSIAGTDPSGGAGVHADLKTFSARGAYGTSVITALVAQNTHGVSRVYDVDPDFVADQFDAVLGDVSVDAAKTGMLGTRELVELVVAKLTQTPVPHLVVDPVMVATSGHRLLRADAIDSVRTLLLPTASLVTPNLPEAALLLGDDVALAHTREQMRTQAVELVSRGAGAALVKGGHGEGDTVLDVLALPDSHGTVRTRTYEHARIATPNTHGTGCTLSGAITAELARRVHALRAGTERADSGEAAEAAAANRAYLAVDADGNRPEVAEAAAANRAYLAVDADGLEAAVFQGLEYLGRALHSSAHWRLSLDPEGAHGPVDHMVDARPYDAPRDSS